MQQPSPNSGKWVPSPFFLANMTHLLGAALVTITAAYKGMPLPWIIVGVIVFALLKEFIADMTFLESDTFAGSLEDFTGYMTGLFLAVLATYTLAGAVVVAGVIIAGMVIWDVESQREGPL